MTKENQSTEKNLEHQFAFGLVGTLLTHNHRAFEEIQEKMHNFMPFLLENEYFDEKTNRQEFFGMMEIIKDLAETTKVFSNKELTKILRKTAKKSLRKLEKEVANA